MNEKRGQKSRRRKDGNKVENKAWGEIGKGGSKVKREGRKERNGRRDDMQNSKIHGFPVVCIFTY